MNRVCLVVFNLVIAFLLLLPLELHAHKVSIYAYSGDGMVHSESYFADGSKCRNCVVEVFDNKTGKKLLEGKTDENGKFSFEIPSAASLKLILKAGAGHQGVYLLSEKEMGGNLSNYKTPDTAASPTKKPENIKSKPSEDKDDYGVAVKGGGCLSPAELELVVNKAVEAKLQPVMSQLAMIQENTGKARAAEIIGGIGYIFGIMGIIMYFKGRKNSGK